VARALIDGKVSLHAFTEAAVREPNVLKLAERVQMHLGNDLKKTDPGGRPCRVTLRAKDGQTYIREAEHAKGSPEFPMTEAELRGKFSECARETLSAEAADRALAQIEGLEKVDNVRSLRDSSRLTRRWRAKASPRRTRRARSSEIDLSETFVFFVVKENVSICVIIHF
jgi:2-methylcitrate dehydratase